MDRHRNGLNLLYNPNTNNFTSFYLNPINNKVNNVIITTEEDRQGNLWLGNREENGFICF